MQTGQMKLWVDQPRDTESVWPAMSETDRTQVARCYGQAIGKAARMTAPRQAVSEGEQPDDNSK